ncbi:bifunctional hydroxymethylpyrimidine kinase/phosphomethylpyrimidine kinase, partial [Klebsiella pneumoniae]
MLAFPESDFRTFNTQRIPGVNSHGSGCSLASAIAA